MLRWLPGFRLLDGLLGALLTAAFASGSPGSPAPRCCSRSAATRCAADVEPRRSCGRSTASCRRRGRSSVRWRSIDPLPSISGPPADVSPPTDAILAAPAVTRATASVVRITGQACGVGIEGSGWVAAPDVVVTNAHVVAGESYTLVQLGGIGAGLRTRRVLFDPHNDIAVLRVSGLNDPALPLASRASGRDSRRDPRLPGGRALRRRAGPAR